MKRRAAPPRAEALDLLRALVEELRRSARTIESRTGVSNAQLFLLRDLRARGPLPLTRLAESARTTPSTASIIVQRLVRGGFAVKTRSRTDRRSVDVSLTSRGRRLLRRAPAPTTAKVIRALEHLSDSEARALSRALRSLARALKLAPRSPSMLFEDPPSRRRSR